jgi:protein-S-isoprenylcysteine O-methyltransferase Ste14
LVSAWKLREGPAGGGWPPFHLFVLFYEEPTLREKFGADVQRKEYRCNVRRWWPRLRAKRRLKADVDPGGV